MNNSIQNNRWGVYIWETNNVRISGNFIAGNSLCGMYLFSSGNNVIMRNNFTNNDHGLHLWRVKYTIIKENNFIKNKVWTFESNLESFFCRWQRNYYDKSQIFPKIITGASAIWNIPYPIGVIFIPYIKIDWRPAQEPYDIPGMR